jgi:hypothetical protein
MTSSQGSGQAPPGRDRVGALAGLASVAAFLAGLRPVAVAAGAVAAAVGVRAAGRDRRLSPRRWRSTSAWSAART